MNASIYPPEDADYEVWCNGEFAAAVSGSQKDAWRDMMHYVSQYSPDGPIQVFEVTRKLIIDGTQTKQVDANSVES